MNISLDKIYWGSPGVISGNLDGAVNVGNTDGTSLTKLVPHTDGLGRALAVDPDTSIIFFTSWDIFNPSSGGSIWRVNSDGSGLNQLPLVGLTGVTDIEVDSEQQRIWFTDFQSGTIQSANFDGTEQVIEISGLQYPLGLALEFEQTIQVDIDIKPNSDPNSINLCSNGTVPIAIYGSELFDIYEVDTNSLRFAEATVKVVGKKDPHSLCDYSDINSDSFTDLVCHFVTSDLASIDNESTHAVVNGQLFSGIDIQGEDSVNIVKDSCN